MTVDDFRTDLTRLLNRYSLENTSNTPDFILATYLYRCLMAFDSATNERDRWYGIAPAPGWDGRRADEPDGDGDGAFLLLTGEKLRTVNQDQALVIRLSRKEAPIVRDVLAAAVDDQDEATVWVDPVDRAFKIKVAAPLAVWSPPMGTPA